MHARSILLLCFLSSTLCRPAAAQPAAPDFPASYEEWVQKRVGPVIYPSEEKPRHDWDELTSIAREVGAPAAKTWVGPRKPGDALKTIQSPPYHRLIEEFQIVHFNISPHYTADGYKDGKIPAETLAAIKDEWRNVTTYLCQESKIPGQMFLLSVGGEINVYYGTQRGHPDFPVAEYVNACHDAVTEALAAIKGPHPAVYTVAEIQTDVEYEAFCARWAPEFRTDLIALSHYTFYRDLVEALNIIKPHVKALGPFGANRFMLGEYGPTMEICNWNQAAQVRANDRILHDAFHAGFQFAFFYEVADEPTVIKASGHDGLVAWNSDESPYCRLLWFYYHDLYKNRKRTVPAYDLYEIHDRRAPDPDPKLPNLTLEKVTGPGQYVAGEPVVFKAHVASTGPTEAPGTAVSYYVDDVMVSYAAIPPLKTGERVTAGSDERDKRFVWKAAPGSHCIRAVIDRRNTIRESTRNDNQAEIWIHVPDASGK